MHIWCNGALKCGVVRLNSLRLSENFLLVLMENHLLQRSPLQLIHANFWFPDHVRRVHNRAMENISIWDKTTTPTLLILPNGVSECWCTKWPNAPKVKTSHNSSMYSNTMPSLWKFQIQHRLYETSQYNTWELVYGPESLPGSDSIILRALFMAHGL